MTYKINNMRNSKGFSLMEMLIVLALIALVIGIAVKNYDSLFGGGQKSVAMMFVKDSIKLPLMRYKIDMGTYPSTEDGLRALIEAPADAKPGSWKGPYLDEDEIPLDPWKNAYQYKFPGEKNSKDKYDVWSRGPDGLDSEDDIGNWTKKTQN